MKENLFSTEKDPRKFYIIYYVDPDSDEPKFFFADTFAFACNKAEAIIRELERSDSVKVHIFEEVLTFIKHEIKDEEFRKEIDWGFNKIGKRGKHKKV